MLKPKNRYLLMTALAAGTAGTGNAAGTSRPNVKRPNVIFILMDDAGHGDFGCYGQTRTETPNIDALARSGILFTDMSTASAFSTFEMRLLTGQHTASDPRHKEGVNVPPGSNLWTTAQLTWIHLEGRQKWSGHDVGTLMKAGTTAMIGNGGRRTASSVLEDGLRHYYGCLHKSRPTIILNISGERQKVYLNPNARFRAALDERRPLTGAAMKSTAATSPRTRCTDLNLSWNDEAFF